MAIISRDQFDETKAVQKKLWQVGVPVMDADLNEQNDVNLERHRRVLSALLGRTDAGFVNPNWSNGSGFAIAVHNTALTVYVVPGDAAFHLDDDHAAIVTHAGVTELTGFSSWVGGGVSRTDIIYIDIEEKEISPADDPDIVNPLNGKETCRDIRLEYEVKIASGTSSVPTAPSGHVYRGLAKISKDASSDQIVADDIELLLTSLAVTAALESMEIPFWMEASVSHGSFDAQGLENDDFAFKVDEDGGGSKTNIVIKVPYVYDPAHQYLVLHCQTKRLTGVEAWVRLDGFSETGTTATIPWVGANPPSDTVSYLEIPSGLTVGQVYELQVVLYGSATGQNAVWMYRPVISAGVGQFHWGQGGV